jgi:hypothetical protein
MALVLVVVLFFDRTVLQPVTDKYVGRIKA